MVDANDEFLRIRISSFGTSPMPVAVSGRHSYPTFGQTTGNTAEPGRARVSRFRSVKSQDRSSKRLLIAIVLALAAWGVLLAVGAYLGLWSQGPQRSGLRDLRRFWVVLGAVGGFLALWGGALAVRTMRTRSRNERDHQ